MRIIRVRDYADLSRRAADILAEAVLSNPGCVLGLATGETPLGVYGNLAEKFEKGDVDFSRVRTVNLDEYRGVSAKSDQSYRYYMDTNFFGRINIKPENTHVPDGLAEDPLSECAAYDALIDGFGGIDVQLLGIGNNGHIGFNEPGGVFVRDTHVVDLSESTIAANSRFFSRAEDVPIQAYTMGIGPIMRARRILMIVSGTHKADIVKRAFYGDIAPDVPASILQLHCDVTLVGDEAALSSV
jgi:glucosamine-6-phosphate deaminase